jgi:hypothetical protein
MSASVGCGSGGSVPSPEASRRRPPAGGIPPEAPRRRPPAGGNRGVAGARWPIAARGALRCPQNDFLTVE